ncbi:anti-sigma factor family protein [Zavarzinella formosa]|uniref:anti-sigma factor family protein n=1 Tax=Zavarzinella formosa TaxID=360055 RepID=UPI00030EE99F|nr:hypothetical protein [Zavarzinella formosa]
MLTCRRATERLSRSLDVPLPVVEKIGMEGHMLLCGHCRRFRRQIVILDAICKDVGDRIAGEETALPASARQRIVAALAQSETGSEP